MDPVASLGWLARLPPPSPCSSGNPYSRADTPQCRKAIPAAGPRGLGISQLKIAAAAAAGRFPWLSMCIWRHVLCISGGARMTSRHTTRKKERRRQGLLASRSTCGRIKGAAASNRACSGGQTCFKTSFERETLCSIFAFLPWSKERLVVVGVDEGVCVCVCLPNSPPRVVPCILCNAPSRSRCAHHTAKPVYALVYPTLVVPS